MQQSIRHSAPLFASVDSERKLWWDVLLAFCLMGQGYWFGNRYYGLLAVFLYLFAERRWIFDQWKHLRLLRPGKTEFRFILPLVVFMLGASVNKFVNGQSIDCTADLYAPFIFVPAIVLMAARLITPRLVNTIIVLLAIEVVVGLIEYTSGNRTLFLGGFDTTIKHYDSLYFSRVFGFGNNSSIFALRCFTGLFILPLVSFSRIWKKVLYWVLIIGILVSFNRSVIVGCMVFFIVDILFKTIQFRKGIKQDFVFYLISFLLLFSFTLTPFFKTSFTKGDAAESLDKSAFKSLQHVDWSVYHLDCSQENSIVMKTSSEISDKGQWAKNALAKDMGVNTSGRLLIWLNYLDFISNHSLWGLGSDKVMLRRINYRAQKVETIHAHNSFLMLFSMHGLVLGGCFLGMLLLWWRGKNLSIILAILAYSMTQYGVFWGVSWLDILFIFALIIPRNIHEFGQKSAYSGH